MWQVPHHCTSFGWLCPPCDRFARIIQLRLVSSLTAGAVRFARPGDASSVCCAALLILLFLVVHFILLLRLVWIWVGAMSKVSNLLLINDSHINDPSNTGHLLNDRQWFARVEMGGKVIEFKENWLKLMKIKKCSYFSLKRKSIPPAVNRGTAPRT